MFRIACLAIGLLVASTALPASAQQNPLSKLFHKLGAQSAPQSPPAQSGPPVPGNLVDILQTYAQEAPSIVQHSIRAGSQCHPDSAYISDQIIEADFKLGRYGMAAAGFTSRATSIAWCAVGGHPSDHFQRIPLPMAINLVGSSLAMAVIAQVRSSPGSILAQTKVQARDAMTLLNYNAAANSSLIGSLQQTGVLGRAPLGAVSSSESVGMTAAAAVSAYKSNNFAFTSKYKDRTLAITGKVQSVSGSEDQALVTLVGYMPKDHDLQGFQDLIRCAVTDHSALPAVANLKKGSSTTVIGVYSGPEAFDVPGIKLNRCRVQ